MANKKIIKPLPAQVDGVQINELPAEKLGFFGATPIVQPSGATQAAAVDAAGALILVNKLRTDLVALGIIKGAA